MLPIRLRDRSPTTSTRRPRLAWRPAWVVAAALSLASCYSSQRMVRDTAELTKCEQDAVRTFDESKRPGVHYWKAECQGRQYVCSRDMVHTGCSPARDSADRQQASVGHLGCAAAQIEVFDEEADGPVDTWSARCNGKTVHCTRTGGTAGAVSCRDPASDASTEHAPADWAPSSG